MCPLCCLAPHNDDPILHKCISAVFVIVAAALKHRRTCGTLWKGTVHPHFRPTRLKHRSNDIYVQPVFVYCLILLPCVLNQKQQLNLMFLQKLQQARVFKNLLVLKAKQLCCRYTWKDAAELQITGSGRWDVALSLINAHMYIGGGWFPPAVSPPKRPACVTSMHHQQLSDLHKVSPVKQHFCSPPSVRHGGKSPTVFYIWLRVGLCHVCNGAELCGWRIIAIHCRKGLTDLHFNLFFKLYSTQRQSCCRKWTEIWEGCDYEEIHMNFFHYTWTLQV